MQISTSGWAKGINRVINNINNVITDIAVIAVITVIVTTSNRTSDFGGAPGHGGVDHRQRRIHVM